MEKQKPSQIFEHKNTEVLLCSTEHLDVDGNIFKSTKSLVDALTKRATRDVSIVFCPECEEGAQINDWLPARKTKLKDKNSPTSYRGTIECPHCGHKIHDISWTVEPTFIAREIKSEHNYEDELPFDVADMEYITDCEHPAIFLDRYQNKNLNCVYCTNAGAVSLKTVLKVWPVSDDKLAMEWSAKYASPKTSYGKYWLQKSTERYRFVFNLKTGHSYIMQGIDAFGKPIKNNLINSRINQITLSGNNHRLHFGFPDEIKDVVLTALEEYHGFRNNAARAINSKCSIGEVAQLNYFYNIPECHLPYLIDFCYYGGTNASSKRMVHDMKKALLANSFNVFPKYMQKRSIKKRLRKNITLSAVYRWLHKCNITDINVMNNIVDNMSNSVFRNMHSNMCGDDSAQLVEFIKWVVKGRNADSVKTIIVNAFDNNYYLSDSARMLKQILAANIEVDNSGNIKEIHDRIMHEYNKMRFRNRTITYEKSEQNFEQTVDDYQFVLAEDTDRLYDIGNTLRICVGSYGERAVAKRCTIVTMQKDNQYVACIELYKNQGHWYMNQLKAKFNHTVKEIEPVTKWVASTGIVAESCPDYQRAITHSTSSFDGDERDYHVDNPRFGNRAPAFDYNPPARNDNWDDFAFDGPF